MSLFSLKTLTSESHPIGDGGRLARLSNFTIYTVGALFLFLLIWSAFAEIDEVTRGDGKVIPSQKIQSIQSAEPGVVEQILVHLGQHVSKGELLIRLDNTMTESNLGEDEAKARSLVAQIARLQIERTGDLSSPYVCPDELKQVAADVCATESLLLQTRRAEENQKLDSLRERVEERQRELNEAQDDAQRIGQGLTLAQQEFDLISPMAQRSIAPKTDLLKVERDLVDLKGQQAANQQVIAKTQAALREAHNNLADAALQIQSDALSDQSKADAELSVLRETIKGAKEHNRRTDIRSPVDGIINTLDTNTIGAFVNAGSHVMDIVPIEDKLLIETRVKPRDIAFVTPGQKALVKLTAYDFFDLRRSQRRRAAGLGRQRLRRQVSGNVLHHSRRDRR